MDTVSKLLTFKKWSPWGTVPWVSVQCWHLCCDAAAAAVHAGNAASRVPSVVREVTSNKVYGPESRHDIRPSLHLTSWVKIKKQQKWPNGDLAVRVFCGWQWLATTPNAIDLETVQTVRKMRTRLETTTHNVQDTLRNIPMIKCINPIKLQKKSGIPT